MLRCLTGPFKIGFILFETWLYRDSIGQNQGQLGNFSAQIQTSEAVALKELIFLKTCLDFSISDSGGSIGFYKATDSGGAIGF